MNTRYGPQRPFSPIALVKNQNKNGIGITGLSDIGARATKKA